MQNQSYCVANSGNMRSLDRKPWYLSISRGMLVSRWLLGHRSDKPLSPINYLCSKSACISVLITTLRQWHIQRKDTGTFVVKEDTGVWSRNWLWICCIEPWILKTGAPQWILCRRSSNDQALERLVVNKAAEDDKGRAGLVCRHHMTGSLEENTKTGISDFGHDKLYNVMAQGGGIGGQIWIKYQTSQGSLTYQEPKLKILHGNKCFFLFL